MMDRTNMRKIWILQVWKYLTDIWLALGDDISSPYIMVLFTNPVKIIFPKSIKSF